MVKKIFDSNDEDDIALPAVQASASASASASAKSNVATIQADSDSDEAPEEIGRASQTEARHSIKQVEQEELKRSKLAKQARREKAQRLQNQAEQSKKRKRTAAPEAALELFKNDHDEERHKDVAPQPPIASTSSSTHLDPSIFLSAEKERQQQLELEQQAAQQLSKNNSKRKAHLSKHKQPRAGSSIILPRGDIVQHVVAHQSCPDQSSALLRPRKSRTLLHSVVAKSKRPLSDVKLKQARDGATKPLALRSLLSDDPDDKHKRAKRKSAKFNQDRLETVRHRATLVHARRHSAAGGSVKGFATASY